MITQHTPLLIVDVQNGFVNDNSRHIVPNVKKLAEHWIRKDAPVYMSQFTNFPGSQWETLIGWRRLTDEKEIAIIAELSEVAERANVYRKRSYSCLVGPFLEDLKKHRWGEVVICGIATDGCVLATAIDLFEYAPHPIRPVVVSDAVASHAGAPIHEAGLLLIDRFIGKSQVVPTSTLIED